jgi:prepilin-type N-terminal cleavage/methylation domain-containing protein
MIEIHEGMKFRSILLARKGFTLVELLVVIVVVTILSAVMISYNSASRAQLAVMVEEARIAQLLLRAKSLAVATYNQPSVPCGFGLHIDYAARRYSLATYDIPTCANLPSAALASIASDVEVFTLNTDLLFDRETDPTTAHDIVFVPPQPSVLLSNPSGLILSGTGFVHLRGRVGSATGDVSVNSAGQVTF